jgi:hypothetical protein
LAGKLRQEDGPEVPDTLAVWELVSGKILARLPKAKFITQVVFSSDGRTLAFVDGWGIHLHDLLNGKELAAYPAPDVTCEITNRGCGTQTIAFSPDHRMLATGHRDGAVLLWKVPQKSDDNPHELTDAERDALWTDLGSESPVKAQVAIERLVRSRSAAVALITAKMGLHPAPVDTAIAALVQELDSDEFATRENAMKKLREYGARAELPLRKALQGSTSLEMMRRIDILLESMPVPLQELPLSGDALRAVRAVELLERINTTDSKNLLEALAMGAADARQTQEAKASLGRLGKQWAAP